MRAAKRIDMADAEDPHRAVKTDSRERVIYGIGVSIIGGMTSQPGRLLTCQPIF
jgi:hypothetical protein